MHVLAILAPLEFFFESYFAIVSSVTRSDQYSLLQVDVPFTPFNSVSPQSPSPAIVSYLVISGSSCCVASVMLSMTFSIILRRRNVTRVLVIVCLAFAAKYIFAPSSSASANNRAEIRKHGVLDLVSRSDRVLDVQRHDFLQVRMGRDERGDVFQKYMRDGVDDFWERFEKP